MNQKWDRRFLEMAALLASWSKDPSTQCGALIVSPDKIVRSMGYNGFPKGVKDTKERLEDRPTKYRYMVHAELNAIISAGRQAEGCSLYVYPFSPCSDCAKAIVQAGIIEVVCPVAPSDLRSRWSDSMDAAKCIFEEAEITFREIQQ